MSERSCLKMKKHLKEYLLEQNAEMIDELKKDIAKPIAIDEELLACKRRILAKATNEIQLIGSVVSEPKVDTKLLESSPVEPVQLRKSRSCACKYSLVVLVVVLTLVIAYTIGIISGITGQPFPFGWITDDFPKIYY